MYLVVLRLVCHVIFIYLCSVGAHVFFFFFFNDTATTEIYTLSLHDALPIWELVGLSSYLLIGFWFHKPSAAAAAKKAFIVTRIGDLGLLAALLLIWTRTGTFDIAEIQHIAETHQVASWVITFFALGVFAGAAGKS